MSNAIAQLLERNGSLVADGGMGTSLFELGLQAGSTPELWNVEFPERVAKVHQGFVDAGSDIILTNTFGGTRARLDLDGLGDRLKELNAAGVQVARSVAATAAREVIVAGSVGPTGLLFEPMGPLDHATAVELFTEQVEVLASSGAQVIWIETLSSTEELAAAVEAAATTGLPIVSTMSFDTHGSTMMGIPPSALANWWNTSEVTPFAVGANCGIGPSDVVAAVAGIREASGEVVIVAKGNCGIPEVIDGTLWYPTSSDDMTAYAELALNAGARIIGACCGSVPAHIAQIRQAVDRHQPGAFQFTELENRLGPVSRPGEARQRERKGRRRAE
ncbi:MAG: betaine--homocysteine S-methyltransferase [Acidimicrobiia bacterium]